jgi:hypothetical protein
MPGGNGGLRGGSSALAVEIVGKLKDDLLVIKLGVMLVVVIVAWIASKM